MSQDHSGRFEGTSDIDLVLMLYETKKARHPEDREFIRAAQLELRERQKAFYKKESSK